MQDLDNLRVWRLAKEFSADVIGQLTPRACQHVPGLRNQAIRAVLSIAANIAEGSGRSTTREFRRYIDTSLGSLYEVRSHLDTALAVHVLQQKAHKRLSDRAVTLRRMLIALRKRLED